MNALPKIVAIGEILVEIMADTIGDGFLTPLALTGPFPSGSPAIYIDQVARLGHPCAIVSAVGADDFGRVNLDRLRQDGVDVSGIHIDAERPTGSAFVRYRADGSRDFVFNIRHSAAGTLTTTPAMRQVLDGAGHVHVMGSSLSSDELVEMNLRAVRAVRERGGTVSFDPNLRKELSASDNLRQAMDEILSLTNLFLPSGDEITLLTRAKTEEGAIAELLSQGVTAVAHKLGARGVRYHDPQGSRYCPAFRVEEIDPTGAGDCFGGAFTALWLQRHPLEDALRLASAAGAIAVTRRGPMEGASDLATLQRFVASHEQVAHDTPAA